MYSLIRCDALESKKSKKRWRENFKYEIEMNFIFQCQDGLLIQEHELEGLQGNTTSTGGSGI